MAASPTAPRPRRRPLAVRSLLCALALLFVAASVATADAFDNAKAVYERYLARPSLYKRTLGRRKLAETKDQRALQVLIDSYKKPEEPREQNRYLITTIACDAFTTRKSVPALTEWRERMGKKPEDAWLWFRTLNVQTKVGLFDDVMEIADKHRDPWQRAAAMRALIAEHHRPVLARIPQWIESLPSNKFDKGLLLESMSWALSTFKEIRMEEDFQAAGMALIAQLDERAQNDRVKLTIARQLALTLGTDVLALEGEPWIAELRTGGSGAGGFDARYASFGGLRASGDKIAYVIDMSDSMLIPLTSKEKESLEGPTTTGGEGPRPGDLPWEDIENRFDLARELLKKSIRELNEDKKFVVVWFGKEAGLLDSTKGLVDATDRNVDKVCDELDQISPGPTRQLRPHGTLRGETNLHGGIWRAFRAKKSGLVDEHEYVDTKLFDQGVDSIFVLSDGEPSMDDYIQLDTRDPEDHAGDPETGTATQNTPQLWFQGPYLRWYLLDDIKRNEPLPKRGDPLHRHRRGPHGTARADRGAGHGQDAQDRRGRERVARRACYADGFSATTRICRQASVPSNRKSHPKTQRRRNATIPASARIRWIARTRSPLPSIRPPNSSCASGVLWSMSESHAGRCARCWAY